MLFRSAGQLLDRIDAVCELLDGDEGGERYRDALRAQRVKVEDSASTPSARVLREMRDRGESFFEFAMRSSEERRAECLKRPLPDERFAAMRESAEQSLAKEASLVAGDEVDFDEYLRLYFAQA